MVYLEKSGQPMNDFVDNSTAILYKLKLSMDRLSDFNLGKVKIRFYNLALHSFYLVATFSLSIHILSQKKQVRLASFIIFLILQFFLN